MRNKLGLIIIMFITVLALSGCGEQESPIAGYTSVTCLFTATATTEIIDYGTIIMEFNEETVTLMTENGVNVYTDQDDIDGYIDAKFSSDHYSFIENRVTGFEDNGYTCTYE